MLKKKEGRRGKVAGLKKEEKPDVSQVGHQSLIHKRRSGLKTSQGSLALHQDYEKATSSQESKTGKGSMKKKLDSLKSSSTDDSKCLVKRKISSPGVRGKRISIESNYLRMYLNDLKIVFQYDFQFTPEIKKFGDKIFDEFKKRHFLNIPTAFDGRRNIITKQPILIDGESLKDDIHIFLDEDGKIGKTFEVLVQFASKIEISDFKTGTLPPQNILWCLDIICRNSLFKNFNRIGRNFFTNNQPEDLGSGMGLFQGIYQSVIRGSSELLLNIDTTHRAFLKPQSIVELIKNICVDRHLQITDQFLKENELNDCQLQELSKFLKGLRIQYRIPNVVGSTRTYTINGIGGNSKREHFQEYSGRNETSVFDYFRMRKNYLIKFPLLPTIWVGDKKKIPRILLPAELCTIVLGQTRDMSARQTSKMIDSTAISTEERKRNIKMIYEKVDHEKDSCINKFGLKMSDEFVGIEARVLPPPEIIYKNNQSVKPLKGSWRCGNNKFYEGAEIDSWTVISTCGHLPQMKMLAEMIYSCAIKLGMKINNRAEEPFGILNVNFRSRDFRMELNKFLKRRFDLIIVIIPDWNSEIYQSVKKIAELEEGVLTQCIKKRNVIKLSDNPRQSQTLIDNLLLKINTKLNGTNHSVAETTEKLQKILKCKFLIMGADVTHPKPGKESTPSIAAVTISYDDSGFCYNGYFRLQPPKMEIIKDLQEITEKHLNHYMKTHNNEKPDHILFFRDGVSEGQFNTVLKEELKAIERACASFANQPTYLYKPKLTFLVVQKRHHTRFFPTDLKQFRDVINSNVPVGTVVDTVIVNDNIQNYYLLSHYSPRGVARPTKYCTLYDDQDFNNDEIQELTFNLCHLFSRCNKSVSYPAPTYYAHLLAARARLYVDEDVDLGNLAEYQRRIEEKMDIDQKRPMFFV